MDWMQVLTILGGNIGAFLWATMQARADFLHLDRKSEEHRKECAQIMKSIQEEIKDFHNRLCEIELQKKGK
jgi:hypothetical protein